MELKWKVTLNKKNNSEFELSFECLNKDLEKQYKIIGKNDIHKYCSIGQICAELYKNNWIEWEIQNDSRSSLYEKQQPDFMLKSELRKLHQKNNIGG